MKTGKIHPCLMGCFLILLSVFVAISLFEVGYRVYLHWRPQLLIPTSFGEIFQVNAEGFYAGGETSTDQYGFRNKVDADAWHMKNKIMIIGDSVAFGQGVNDQQTISHLLNTLFEESGVGFLNLAHPGWDTRQLRNRLYYYGEALGQWKKIFWLYYINDAQNASVYTPPDGLPDKIINQHRNFYNNRMYTYKGIYDLFVKSRYSLKKIRMDRDERRNTWNSYYALCLRSYGKETVTRKNEQLYIRDILHWGKAYNSEIVFFLCPAETQFVDNKTAPQNFMKSLGQEWHFPVVDLYVPLLEANAEERVFLPGDHAHYNERGNAVVAEVIKNYLVESWEEKRLVMKKKQ